MAKRDDWIHCPDCDEEFNVIATSTVDPSYCPFCGEYLTLDEDFEELDPDDDMDL